MRPLFNLPNAVTLGGLVAALLALRAGLGHAPHLAFAWLVAAGLCDLFDGYLARRLPLSALERRFGARLDSLVDVCSFGVTPAVLLYVSAGGSRIGLAALLALPACAVWRLAWFDTVGLEREGPTERYRGLPVTFVALVLPLVGALAPPLGWCVAGLLLAGLMVSPLPVPKPKGRWYAVLFALAVGLVGFHVRAHLRVEDGGTFSSRR